MISNRPMIPMLTHVDNLGDIDLDMSAQERSLETIANNTSLANTHLVDIENNSLEIIRQDMARANELNEQINNDTGSIKTAVGRITDADTATTVIGLLKSIVNKLS